jgi:hypothetical protein
MSFRQSQTFANSVLENIADLTGVNHFKRKKRMTAKMLQHYPQKCLAFASI